MTLVTGAAGGATLAQRASGGRPMYGDDRTHRGKPGETAAFLVAALVFLVVMFVVSVGLGLLFRHGSMLFFSTIGCVLGFLVARAVWNKLDDLVEARWQRKLKDSIRH